MVLILDIVALLVILFQPQPLNVFQNGHFNLLNIVPVPLLSVIALYISFKLPKSLKTVRYLSQIVMVIATLFIIYWLFAALSPNTNLPYAK